MLPLPTVTNIDIPAEELKMAASRAPAGGIDLAGATRDAQTVAHNAMTISANSDAREQAQWFQREYVDKGWDGAEKLWQEMGAPGELNPKYARTSADAAPATWFQMAAKYTQGEKAKKSTGAYAELVSKGVKQPDGTYRPATQEELDAAEIDAGTQAGEGFTAVKGVADRGAKRKIEADKLETAEGIAKLRTESQKAIAGMRKAIAASKDAGVIAAIEKDLDRQIEIEAEADRLQGVLDGMTTFARASDKVVGPKIKALDREMAQINARQAGFIAKVADPGKVPTLDDRKKTKGAETPPPATDKAPVAYPDAKKGNDGGWYIPDPKRAGKYLKVG